MLSLSEWHGDRHRHSPSGDVAVVGFLETPVVLHSIASCIVNNYGSLWKHANYLRLTGRLSLATRVRIRSERLSAIGLGYPRLWFLCVRLTLIRVFVKQL